MPLYYWETIKPLKRFGTEATEPGVNQNISFKSKRFRVETEKTDSIYLDEAELKEIYKLDLSNEPKLDRSRDLFLLGAWTGLRFSDFSNIKAENIKGNFIEITPKKTGVPVVIPIHETVKAIISKYNGKNENSLPKAISNVAINEHIKEIAVKIKAFQVKTSTGITKGGVNVTRNVSKFALITSHTARRSFATNLFLDGVSPITIMGITGHKTEKSFLKYIKITPSENAKILQLLFHIH